MTRFVINGPTKLSGKVKIQGAKNSAMKHIFVPLIANDTFTLTNIPKNRTILKLLEIVKIQGCKATWTGVNKLIIDSKNTKLNTIPEELFYETSGGINPIPILASKFGTCSVEINSKRADRGGDKIGSRNLDEIINTLNKCGISVKTKSKKRLDFVLSSKNPFTFKVPVNSFSASIMSLFAALFKKGESTILNYTTVHEFNDIVEFLIATGAKIIKTKNQILVYGPAQIKGIEYKNMYDPHDLVTWISTALTTNSRISVQGIEYEKMNLVSLEKTFQKMNLNINLHSFTTTVKPQLDKIKPISIFAGQYPMFTTEWQVLLSPLLTQINGESRVVETLYANRMQHWNEMKKMGVKFEFFEDPKYPEVNKKPRAVKIVGQQQLHGAIVDARDVRTGAALIIAGLIAKDTTIIENAEHIERGYEAIDKRLLKLGAKVKKDV